jgi:hypothetical protein
MDGKTFTDMPNTIFEYALVDCEKLLKNFSYYIFGHIQIHNNQKWIFLILVEQFLFWSEGGGFDEGGWGSNLEVSLRYSLLDSSGGHQHWMVPKHRDG